MQLIKSSIWSFPPIYLLSIHLLRDFQACLPRSCSEVIFFNVCMSAFLHSWFFFNLPEVPFLIFWKRSSTIQQVSFLFEKKCLKIEACLAVFFRRQIWPNESVCCLKDSLSILFHSLFSHMERNTNIHPSSPSELNQSRIVLDYITGYVFTSHISDGGDVSSFRTFLVSLFQDPLIRYLSRCRSNGGMHQ